MARRMKPRVDEAPFLGTLLGSASSILKGPFHVVAGISRVDIRGRDLVLAQL